MPSNVKVLESPPSFLVDTILVIGALFTARQVASLTKSKNNAHQSAIAQQFESAAESGVAINK